MPGCVYLQAAQSFDSGPGIVVAKIRAGYATAAKCAMGGERQALNFTVDGGVIGAGSRCLEPPGAYLAS